MVCLELYLVLLYTAEQYDVNGLIVIRTENANNTTRQHANHYPLECNGTFCQNCYTTLRLDGQNLPETEQRNTQFMWLGTRQ